MKHFSEQRFLHYLNYLEWEQINLIPDLEIAWEFFYNIFSALVDKHAPLKSYRVKGRDNAWFSPLLITWLGQKLEKQIYSDWLDFRRLRNACTVAVRKAKAGHFLIQTSNNLSNSSTFWKTVKSLTENNKGIQLPSCIMKGSHAVVDKEKMLNCFNEHFIAFGFLFDSIYGAHANSLIVQSENFMSSQLQFLRYVKLLNGLMFQNQQILIGTLFFGTLFSKVSS